jgi:formate hydrogenlyase transcriptional activator
MALTSMKASFPQMIELNAEQQEDILAVSQTLSDDGIEIIGESAGLKRALQLVETVAGTDSAVLILGETGTGKESIAHAIHSLSSRRQQSFVSTNCASIPGGLLESELFGHEKGAYTGAITREIGRFELANGGTIFLDEVGDIPLELQPKLLRVLQEQEFERLGSHRTVRVNFRLIAATHRDLGAMVEKGTFRQDLYYRLNVFPIELPPLRERKDDIPALAWHFVTKYAQRMKKRIEMIKPADMEALVRHDWPGNVRELQNCMERCTILSRGAVLCPPPLGENRQSEAPVASGRTLADAEREHILKALRETEGIIGGPNGAAHLLDVKRTILLYKMRRLGIARPA